jgi:hypothetical protein
MVDQSLINILNNPSYAFLLGLLMVWVLIWKGIALWRAARNSQKYWFLAILLVNSLGILEIIYLFYFSRKKSKEPQSQ